MSFSIRKEHSGQFVSREFQTGASKVGNLIVLVIISLLLLFLSTFSSRLDPVRTYFLDYVASFYEVTDLTEVARDIEDDRLRSREELIDELQRLRDENLILSGKTGTMATVVAENTRLRQLLNASQLLENRVLITEVVGVPPNPLTHILIVDRGIGDSVSVGQPVVDANGLVGQVLRAADHYSEVLMISDRTHALSVESVGSGARVIAEGTGDYGELLLRDISETTGIEVGDELVTSGIGGVFPRGYPVGTVISIDADPDSLFLRVVVRPTAQLDTSRHLLLLFESRETLEPDP